MVVDLFSKRLGKLNDVYQYDNLPVELRVQILHIWRDTLGTGIPQHYADRTSQEAYKLLHDTLCREYGLITLNPVNIPSTPEVSVPQFLLGERRTERVLDIIELSFRYIEQFLADRGISFQLQPRMTAEQAIDELNARFRENGVGYQYVSGKIVRVDSQLIHSQAVAPVLAMLSDTRFAGANAEFLKAFEHYRHGNTKECLSECLRAFESTMKSICTIRKWKFESHDTAKSLIDVCFNAGLIPIFLQSHVGSLRTGLESGVPTVRNKLSGHGQGVRVVDIPPYYASYMLHLTATTILFLVEAEKNLPQV